MVTAKKIRVISVYLHRETTAESRRFAGKRPYFSTLTGCNILKKLSFFTDEQISRIS